MLETCPRCSRRLGAPLKSGRQVCADCGWSSAPAASRRQASTGNASAPARRQGNLVGRILKLCWRIIQRSAVYLVSLVRHKAQEFKQTQPERKEQRQKMVKGLTDRLSALEQSIPTSVEDQAWLTPEIAFEHLGGDPADPSAVVQTLNGKAAVSFARFQLLKSEAEFRAFGLEMDPGRRQANRPWLRALS